MKAAVGTKAQSGVELPPCPVCGRGVPDPLYYESNRYTEGEVVGLSLCPECQLYFTRPRLVRHNVSTREAAYEDLLRKYEGEAQAGFHKNENYRLYLDVAEQHFEIMGLRASLLRSRYRLSLRILSSLREGARMDRSGHRALAAPLPFRHGGERHRFHRVGLFRCEFRRRRAFPCRIDV